MVAESNTSKVIKIFLVQLLQLFKYSQSVPAIVLLVFLGVLVTMSFVYLFGDAAVALANTVIQLFRIPEGTYSWSGFTVEGILKTYTAVSLVLYTGATVLEKVFKVKWTFSVKKKLLALLLYTTLGYGVVYIVFFRQSAGSVLVLALFWLVTLLVSLYALGISWGVNKAQYVLDTIFLNSSHEHID